MGASPVRVARGVLGPDVGFDLDQPPAQHAAARELAAEGTAEEIARDLLGGTAIEGCA